MPGLNIATILSYVLAVAVGVLIYFVYAKLNISKANVSAQKIIDDATSKADNLVKEAILDSTLMQYKLFNYKVHQVLIKIRSRKRN